MADPGFTRIARLGAALLVLCCSLTPIFRGTAYAQVGTPPQSSPYRDIRPGHTLTPTGGYFSGDGGDFGIGPHSGPLLGLRYDVRTSRAVQFGFGVTIGDLQRFIVNPFVTLANRKTGPVDQSVTFLDLALQLNMTGGKSWHRVAPFIGLGGGLAIASSTPADTSGFDFGNEFYLTPGIGFRLFLSQRLHLRAEARATFWKLDYPTTFTQEPVEEPGTPGNPNAVITRGSLAEWTSSSWLSAGLGYSFSP